MSKLYVTDTREKKCGGCNWETSIFYGLGTSKNSARKDFKGINDNNYGLGLCANCMADMIVREKVNINY